MAASAFLSLRLMVCVATTKLCLSSTAAWILYDTSTTLPCTNKALASESVVLTWGSPLFFNSSSRRSYLILFCFKRSIFCWIFFIAIGFSWISFCSNWSKYSCVLDSIYSLCLSIFFWLKLAFLLLWALLLVPSIAMVSPAIRSASFKNETNSLKSCFRALGLSFLKSAIEW